MSTSVDQSQDVYAQCHYLAQARLLRTAYKKICSWSLKFDLTRCAIREDVEESLR